MSSTPKPTLDIGTILDGLEADQKSAIENRLIAMNQAAFAASEKLGPLEEQLNSMKAENDKLVAANSALAADAKIAEVSKQPFSCFAAALFEK